MKKLFSAVLIFSLFNTGAFAQYTPNTWVLENTTGVPGRYFGASFTIGNIIYFGTGTTGPATPYSADFWGFNTVTNMPITGLTAFPGAARTDAVGFSINGIGYMGLGDNASGYLSDMYQYNPVTDHWSPAASLPTSPSTGLAATSSFSINGKGYVCLGAVNATTIASNDLYEYSPTTNTWAAKAPFIGAARAEAISFVIDNIAYVGTGYSTMTISDFYSYNPASNTWAAIAPLPGGGRNAGAGFSVCGYGYAGLSGATHTDFYQYDPTTNVWTAMDSYPGSGYAGTISASVNTIGDTAFGFVGFGNSFPNILYKYYPPGQCIPIATSPITGANTVCVSLTTTLSDATSGGTWSSSNTSVATVVTATGIVTGVALGTAAISYTVSGGSATFIVNVNCPAPNGVTNISNSTGFIAVYPNPAFSELTITSSDKITSIAVCNLLGQTLITHQYNKEQIYIDVADLPTGIYLLKVNGSEVRKFVKQ